MISTGIQLIVGLGNPGAQYAATRHNAGFWFIEQLGTSQPSYEAKFKGSIAHLKIENHECRVLQPTTYINQSGQSVAKVAHFFKIPPQQILVVHDELDLPVGCSRLKFAGNHGGHNGLKDIISQLGTKDFYRLRLGISHPGNKDDVINYVLTRPSVSDKTKILEAIDRALHVLPDIIQGKMEKAMHYLHTV